MFSYSFIIFLLSIGSIVYAVCYAKYEWKQKNKAGATVISLLALCLIIISMIQLMD